MNVINANAEQIDKIMVPLSSEMESLRADFLGIMERCINAVYNLVDMPSRYCENGVDDAAGPVQGVA
jgi:hypothetical protein